MSNEQIIIKRLEKIIENFEELDKKNESKGIKCYLDPSRVVSLLERLIDFIYDLEFITKVQKEHEVE